VEAGNGDTKLLDAWLVWSRDGKSLVLRVTDGSTGLPWQFDGLQPGKYLVSIEYANAKERLVWVGKVTTKAAAFAIASPKEQAKVSAKALSQAKALELARQVVEKALVADHVNLRKRFQDRAMTLPDHPGVWIPAEPKSYHMRKVTVQPKGGWRIKWWTAKEGGLGYEALAEVDRAGKVRLVKAVVSYAQE
jgi:hypothetical protein